MPISPDLGNWLRAAGYENHCFVSWAHTISRDMTRCAERLKERIEEELAPSFNEPKVFLDTRSITAGDEWQRRMAHAVCKSVALVAVCAPIYYRPEHIWCGREWLAMHTLGEERLRNQTYKSIIPVMFRNDGHLPAAVSRLQYIDLTMISTRGSRYYTTIEYKEKVRDIVERIKEIAQAMRSNGALANCDGFAFPDESAFPDYTRPRTPFPFRK